MMRILRSLLEAGLAFGLLLALAVVYHGDKSAGPAPESSPVAAPLNITKQEVRKVEEIPPEPMRIAITPARFDDMGKLLDTLVQATSIR